MLATQSRPVTSRATISTVGSTRLIGRDTQLAALRDAFVSAAEGGTHCVLVTGEAGIGKTRLVSEALAGLDGAVVVTGRAVDMSTGEIPFGVLADTLRDLTRASSSDVLTPAEREVLAPLLPGAAPSARVERVQLLSAFADLLERLAADRFLVWVVEDLHWADSATRDLVNLAARTIRGSFLLIATVRTDDPDRSPAADAALTSYVAGLARTPGCQVLPLGRLSDDEVRQQLVALLGSKPSLDLATRIQQLSDGLPFVVEELAAAAGRPELASASGVASARLTGLSPDTLRLVDAVAVGDGHLRISLVEEVLDVTADELDAALAEAVQAGILVSDAAADALSFRHALLRDAADRAMGPGARRSWHRRWAEVIENNPGVLAADPAALAVAEHWHQARDVRRSIAAAMAARPAAERIADTHQQALLWCRVLRAWPSLEDPEVVAGVSLRQAVAEALALTGPGALADIYAVFDAVPEHLLTESEQAAVSLARALQGEAKGDMDRRFRGMTLDLFDMFDWFTGPRDLFSALALSLGTRLPRDDPRAMPALDLASEIAAAIAEEEGSVRARVGAIETRSHSREFLNDPQAAGDYLERELADLPDQADNFVLLLDGNLMWCRAACGEHRRAQEVGERALARLRHPQLAPGVWEHLVENHSFSLICTGEWACARQLLEESAPWWEDDLRSSNLRLDMLDLNQRGAVDVDRWRARIGEEIPGGAPQAMVRHLVANASAAEGDLAGARVAFLTMWEDPELPRMDDYVWLVLLDAARVEADAAAADPTRADRPEAGAHLSAITEAAGRFHRYGALGDVWPLDLAAQLDRFHGRDARTPLRAALEGWERIGHVPDVAITHLSLAEQHAIHGDREAAREHLAAGREIAMSLEARPMLARADALADRYALTSRERQASDVLTGRETEVLGLLAEGRTNAEIATTLFMSPKTASVHVSRIIAKLGAGNRTEAAAIARRHGLVVGSQ